MTTTSPLALPPSLRVFLDSGCDLAQVLGPERLVTLAERAVEAPRLFPAEQLVDNAGMWRSILDEWLTNGMGEALQAHSEDPQLDVTELAWHIELLDDPELAKRVEAALPPELVEAALARVDCDRRPFRLAVERHTTFSCCVCGESYENTRCVRLAPRGEGYPDVSGLPPLTFCPECIGAAAVGSRQHTTKALPPVSKLPKVATLHQRVSFVCQKLVEEGFSKRSIDVYRYEMTRAEHWFEDVAGYTLRNAPDKEIVRYLDTRKRSWSTRKNIRSSFGHYWRILDRRNPPIWLVRVPRRKRGVSRTLEEEEASALEALARERADRKGLAVLLGMYLALRREEIAMLRWDGFSDDGWVTIVGKGEQEAKLPVHPVVLDALARLDRKDATWVFPGRKAGTHIGVVTVWSWIVELGREAGVELTPHRLRHTCLATANDRTGDLRAVQDFARHAKIDTTSMYTRATAKRLVEVMRSLDYGDVST